MFALGSAVLDSPPAPPRTGLSPGSGIQGHVVSGVECQGSASSLSASPCSVRRAGAYLAPSKGRERPGKAWGAVGGGGGTRHGREEESVSGEWLLGGGPVWSRRG